MRTPEQIEALAPAADRSAQRFPRLRETQLSMVKRFAHDPARSFAPGESLFEVGDHCVPTWFLLSGSVEAFGRDGFDDVTALRELESGQFTGELNELADRPSLTSAKAGSSGCVALPLNATRLRALIVGSAELGELIMRAFILRRVGLLERGVGPVLLGRAGSADLLRLQAFLTRNAYPHLVLSCASERGRQMINDLDLPPEDLPLLICPCGRVLKRPSNEEAGAWLEGSIALDEKGYILTGLSPADAHTPAPLPLQTSLARVFAIGDVRSGSTKRVASAVGEGAAVVAQIHSMLGAVSATA